MGDELPGDVLEYLRANSILSLASATPDGTPHATTLTYVNDGATFYVWMRPDTLTARQLDANPRVAFTIDTYGEGGRAAEGVQASGEARQVLQPEERTRLLGMFAEKFPGIDTSEARHLTFFKLLATQLHHISAPQEPKLGATYNRELVFSVFRELPAEAVDELTANLETQRYRDGDVIVRQGAPADKFFIIVSGDVEVAAQRRRGRAHRRVPQGRAVLRRDRDPARLAADRHGEGQGRCRGPGDAPRHLPRPGRAGRWARPCASTRS